MTPEELAEGLDVRYALRLLGPVPGVMTGLDEPLYRIVTERGALALVGFDGPGVTVEFHPKVEEDRDEWSE